MWSVTNAALVLDYPFIRLVDEEADDLEAMQADQEIGDPNWVVTGEGWISLLSGGKGHTPVIAMEAWEAAPPLDRGEWQQARDLVVEFPSGTLWLSGGTDSGTMGQPMVMPDSGGGRYEVRVKMRTAEEGKSAAELYDQALDANWDGAEPLCIEFWQMQFWPAE